ncbi:hypothetical protein Cni_G09370 [Canna indica]|uniref:Reverse transcriptase zinc-binding domain-containing protein n=1 Tax=Canna indica TaxID=4628 RepID=A0AAQ3K2H8_9LILI|nr:hypothetical protein Cni_G09370 [Canna indica]
MEIKESWLDWIECMQNGLWLSKYSNAIVYHLKRLASNHRPIMLNSRCNINQKYRERKFIFELYWLESEDIAHLIKENRGKNVKQREKSEYFMNCLGNLGKELKLWSRNCFGSLERRLKDTLAELEILEIADEQGLASNAEIITENGKDISETCHIVHAFEGWYRDLWKVDSIDQNLVNWDDLNILKWKKVPNDSHISLTRMFSEHEVVDAMNSLGKGKAPGPNGYSLEFYLNFWDIIKESYMEAIKKINFSKSECFFPSAYPKAKKETICELLGIKESPLPLKYLGAYIDKGKIPVNIERQMISKTYCSKLECWASKNVSQAGKVVLLNLVINSIHMHTLATTWINEDVVKDYEKLARGHLWKSGSSRKGFHLVNWKKVSLSRLKGGLGIRDLRLVKVSIHAKRLLPLLNKKNVSWATLLNQRYQSIHPWTDDYGRSKNWAVKGIFTAMFMLREGLKKRIGNGSETNVWSDPWIECLPLERWPTFINMEKINEVHNVGNLINDKEWNLVLIKQVFGEELVKSIVQIHISRVGCPDKWIWALNNKGKLNCKIAYNYLKKDDEKASDTSFEWRRLWSLKVLPKVKVFIWKLVQVFNYDPGNVNANVNIDVVADVNANIVAPVNADVMAMKQS